VPRDLFDFPDYSIGLNGRFCLRDDAPPVSPGPLPKAAILARLPEGKVEFFDEDHPSSSFSCRRPSSARYSTPARPDDSRRAHPATSVHCSQQGTSVQPYCASSTVKRNHR
jgi:hypothetical protein